MWTQRETSIVYFAGTCRATPSPLNHCRATAGRLSRLRATGGGFSTPRVDRDKWSHLAVNVNGTGTFRRSGFSANLCISTKRRWNDVSSYRRCHGVENIFWLIDLGDQTFVEGLDFGGVVDFVMGDVLCVIAAGDQEYVDEYIVSFCDERKLKWF